jgi:SAM-dependent methyltransferase
MDIREHNKRAWNRKVEEENHWTIPARPEQIANARRGDWHIVLTPVKPVPRSWFPPLAGCRVLGLASGGGQQGPILAAAGAKVTIIDNSPAQLGRDRDVAEREGLDLTTVEGDMRDLSMFADAAFDFIVHPVSNIFVPELAPVWREAFRVLAPGGSLIAGMVNPLTYCFDLALQKEGVLTMRYPLPYADLTSLTPEERSEFIGADEPVEWSHTLEEHIGGQLEAGFVLTGFYEDIWGDQHPEGELFNRFAPFFFATRARKPFPRS